MSENQELLLLEEEEEKKLSLREILDIGKEYWAEVKANWKKIAIFTGLLTAYLVYTVIVAKPEYTSVLTFMVDDDSEGGGGAASILGSLGLTKPTDTNLDKIVALSKTRQIIGDALLTKAKYKEQTDYFGNHFIREYDLHEAWEDSELLKGFLFTHSDFSKYQRHENAALLRLYNMIAGGVNPGLFLPTYTANSGILTFKLTTSNEDLSIQFLDTLFYKLSSYYIIKSIEKEQQTFDLVKHQTDSLKRVIVSKAYGSARFADRNQGLLFTENYVPGLQMQQEGQMAGEIYGKALANLALADYALKDNRPYIQPIDMPIPPLKGVSPSLILNLVLGLLLGSILGAIYFAARKKVREYLAKELAPIEQD